MPPAGMRVLGEYIVERPKHEGRTWTTYVAWHATRPRERFLVRALNSEMASQPVSIEAFARESHLLESLDHRGIVPLVATGVDYGVPLMVSPDIPGQTLRERLASLNAGIAVGEVARIVREVASVLDYLHTHEPPIVHRSLDPSHVFLCEPDDRVKVLEVGYAHAVRIASEGRDDGTSRAPPGYRPPEDVVPGRAISPAVDQFQLACIAFEALAGHTAFPTDPDASIRAVTAGTRPRVSSERPEVSPDVDKILERAWSPDPGSRYASLREFAEALAAALGVDLTKSPPNRPRIESIEMSTASANPAGAIQPVAADATPPRALDDVTREVVVPGATAPPSAAIAGQEVTKEWPAPPARPEPVAPVPATPSKPGAAIAPRPKPPRPGALGPASSKTSNPAMPAVHAAPPVQPAVPPIRAAAASATPPTPKPAATSADADVVPLPSLESILKPVEAMNLPAIEGRGSELPLDPSEFLSDDDSEFAIPAIAPSPVAPPIAEPPPAIPAPSRVEVAPEPPAPAPPPIVPPPSHGRTRAGTLIGHTASPLVAPAGVHGAPETIPVDRGHTPPAGTVAPSESSGPVPLVAPAFATAPAPIAAPTTLGYGTSPDAKPYVASTPTPSVAAPDVAPVYVPPAPVVVPHRGGSFAAESDSARSVAAPQPKSNAVLISVILGVSIIAAAGIVTFGFILRTDHGSNPIAGGGGTVPSSSVDAAVAIANDATTGNVAVGTAGTSDGSVAVAHDARAVAARSRDAGIAAAAVRDGGAVVVAAHDAGGASQVAVRTGPLPDRPPWHAVVDLRERLDHDINLCPGRYGRHLRMTVVYAGATGQATTIEIAGGYFTQEPIHACIEAAVRAAPLPAFARPTFEASYEIHVH